MQPDNTLSFVISDLANESDASFHAFGTPGPIPLNSWSHVAAVYDQSTGKRQIYVNAVKVAERTDAPITIYNTANDAAIGARMASSTVPDNFFGGKIDELSYYNHALTTNEIAAIYNAGTAGKCKTPVGAKITQQPQSLSVTAGDSASSTVVATGT